MKITSEIKYTGKISSHATSKKYTF